MNILAFDTSTECLTVAASRSSGFGKGASEICDFGALQHAEKIILLIDQALKEAGLTLEACDAFVIGQGPGSFTGLRVGFGTLQGLAVSTGKPCYGISSLDITAQAGVGQEAQIGVVMDARREKIYLGLYEAKNGKLNSQGKYFCVHPEDGIRELKKVRGTLWLTGTGLSKYGDFLKKNLPNALFAKQDFWYPRGSNLIQLFNERKQQLKPLAESELIPLYLQEPHIGPVKNKVHGH